MALCILGNCTLVWVTWVIICKPLQKRLLSWNYFIIRAMNLKELVWRWSSYFLFLGILSNSQTPPRLPLRSFQVRCGSSSTFLLVLHVWLEAGAATVPDQIKNPRPERLNWNWGDGIRTLFMLILCRNLDIPARYHPQIIKLPLLEPPTPLWRLTSKTQHSPLHLHMHRETSSNSRLLCLGFHVK